MRQTPTMEKPDPLTRIQEEIKEVVRREREYHRHLTSGPDEDNSINNNTHDDSHSNANLSINSMKQTHATLMEHPHHDHLSNTPSLTSSVNSKGSIDEQHSDDSGISASFSPINGAPMHVNTKNNNNNEEPKTANSKEQRYIGPNCYSMIPEPPQQKVKIRAFSTAQLARNKPRQMAFTPAHKGVMQRFIASRGKLQLQQHAVRNKRITTDEITTAALTNANLPNTPPSSPTTGAFGTPLISDIGVHHPVSIIIPPVTMTASVIERDAEGKPIRPGYVPVAVKIQRELNDIKTRESELKKIRRIRQSTQDLLESLNNEESDTDGEVEHCYGPGTLRSAKSFGELYETAQSHGSFSPSPTPSPHFESKMNPNRNGGMRPAMSLAELCDLDPEDTPSSHRLIAQWESLIQQNA